MPYNNHAILTLGECLSHTDMTIRRNALSILKQLQKLGNDSRSVLLKGPPRVDICQAGGCNNKATETIYDEAQRKYTLCNDCFVAYEVSHNR